MRQVQVPKKTPVKTKPKLSWKLVAALFVIMVFIFVVGPRLQENNTASEASSGFNKTQYSINDPESPWVIVNKGRAMPAGYVPSDLIAPNVTLRLPSTDPEMQIRTIAAASLQQMFKDAGAKGLQLMLSSGYRSYSLQATVYGSNVGLQGHQADSSSAKPGHSEHQTGLAVDIEPISRQCEVETCFADMPEGKWLAANAYKYGFIIRYQKSQQNLTGYEYEPWHVRYVGKALSEQIHETNQTLEQFFSLPKYTDYPANPYVLSVNS
jgi:D-alanyl-D-alanine carboxypeptidase